MSLSVPNNPLSVNPGVSTPTSNPTPVLSARTLVNQRIGVTQNGSTGSGIPKAVTNVQASVANASAGATSTVNVQFRRDPSDTTFSRVLIFAKGYQGNSTPVQVGSATDSPATCILNNTGEAITLLVQATGNGGAVPLLKCPSVGLQLPKSAGGGVGVTTTTQIVTSSGNSVPSIPNGNGAFMVSDGKLNFPSSGNTPSNIIVVHSPNQIIAVRFALDIQITLSKVFISSGSYAGGPFNFGCAIYSAAGSKVIDSGVLALPAAGGISSKSFTAATLSAGVYYFAWSCDSTTPTVFASQIASASATFMNADATALNMVHSATGWSSSTGFPSSIGTLSADTSPPMPFVLWRTS